jgi:hypothetical protein
MAVLIWLLRVITGFIGFFVLLICLVEISGLIPYSDESPTFIERLVHYMPLLLFSLVLFAPHSLFNQGMRYRFLFVAYVIASVFGIHTTFLDFNLNYSGVLTWPIIVWATLFTILPISNGLALWYWHKNPNVIT